MTSTPKTIRELTRVTAGMATSDGAGVSLQRLIGGPDLDMVDPFLLLDAFGSDRPDQYIAGFPSHPHRGFETVTYMLAGAMRHKDNAGHEGVITAGGVQWMTAGRGIVHSEMPEQEKGLLSGFQLWINLPAAEKMTAPRYQEFTADEIPLEQAEKYSARVIAGQTDAGTMGAVTVAATAALYLDVSLTAGANFQQTLLRSHNGFVYVIDGTLTIGENATPLGQGSLGLLGEGDHVRVTAQDAPCRFLLIGGRALGEPVARHGPFVMNTTDELQQAFADYQQGRF